MHSVFHPSAGTWSGETWVSTQYECAHVSILRLGRARILAHASAVSIVPYTPTRLQHIASDSVARYFTGQPDRVFGVATSCSSSPHQGHSREGDLDPSGRHCRSLRPGLGTSRARNESLFRTLRSFVDHADRSHPSPRLQKLSYKIIKKYRSGKKAITLLTSAARQPHIV